MTHRTSRNGTLDTRKLFALLMTAIGVLFFLSIVSAGAPAGPFVSSEVQFTDGSASGLSIVPASCPSSPHYAGECGVAVTPGSTGSSGINEPPAVSGNACVIGLSPSTIIVGGSAVLAWNSNYSIFGIPFSTTGTITPAPGSVAASGVTTVSPSATTNYVGTFTPTGSLSGIPQSWLMPVTCSATLTVLQSTPGASQCVQQNFCVGNNIYRQETSCANTFVQTCPFGCSNGVCLGAPSPTGFLRVRPALVRAGDTTTVEWSASQVASCTVTGTNGDSWSGGGGALTSSPILSQTTYTLSCIGLDESSLSRSAVVNVVPVFNEQ